VIAGSRRRLLVIDADLPKRYAAHEWVLVTGDDAMPAEHGSVIRETTATIATVHSDRPESIPEAHWYRDVVHRWAHGIQEQAPATVRRYSLRGLRSGRPVGGTPA